MYRKCDTLMKMKTHFSALKAIRPTLLSENGLPLHLQGKIHDAEKMVGASEGKCRMRTVQAPGACRLFAVRMGPGTGSVFKAARRHWRSGPRAFAVWAERTMWSLYLCREASRIIGLVVDPCSARVVRGGGGTEAVGASVGGCRLFASWMGPGAKSISELWAAACCPRAQEERTGIVNRVMRAKVTFL